MVSGSPRPDVIGKRVNREVIIEGEPENARARATTVKNAGVGIPAGFDLAERLHRDASRRCHFTQACLAPCIAQNGTEAPAAFDLPRLQWVSDHARMIIPV